MAVTIRDPLIPVLLVEDDEEDIVITQRAFKKGRIANPLHVVRSGEEAIAYLCRTGAYADPLTLPRPGLVLLDLNMPRMNGREVLKEIKSSPDLRSMPVVVLTTSSEEMDVLGCYEQGANTFITKPVDFAKFVEAVIVIGEYWLCFARIPDFERRAST